MSHQASVPTKVAQYFTAIGVGTFHNHPIVTKVFTPGKGWKHYPVRKRVSLHWARQVRAEGVTDVALSAGGHEVDFRIEELVH